MSSIEPMTHGSRERSFTWLDGERLVRFGDGAVGEAPAHLSGRGFDALLTTPRARDTAPGLAHRAAIVLEVPDGVVPDAAARVRPEIGGRPLVALGGGRVVDSAKAIAGADGLLCAAVPTTLSGAEMTGFHRLPAGAEGGRLVRPSLVVASPALMASQPMPGLAASAMNALGHAVEALYTSLANPVAELAALRASTLIGAAGLADEPPRRAELALAAVLAGYAVGSTGYAVHHVVCQTLVRVAGSPHAETNAVMLPHTVRAMAPYAPEALGRLAEALGGPADASAAADLVAGLAARAGPTRLSDIGVSPDRLADAAAEASSRAELANGPASAGAIDVHELLRAAL